MKEQRTNSTISAFVSGSTRLVSTVFGSVVNSSTMPEQTLGNALCGLWHKQDSTLVAEQTAISSIFAFFVSIYSILSRGRECHQK